MTIAFSDGLKKALMAAMLEHRVRDALKVHGIDASTWSAGDIMQFAVDVAPPLVAVLGLTVDCAPERSDGRSGSALN